MDFLSLEGLDLSDEQGDVSRVRDDMAVLDQYYDQIAAQGGICREQAQALVRDCSVQIDPSFPIASFTQVPSKTNYAVAMEGIIAQTGRMVWDLIKKAAQLLLKIVRFIAEQIRNAVRNRQEIRKAIAMAVGIHNVNKDARARGVSSVEVPPSHKAAVERAQHEIDTARESWDSNFNDLVYDMIGDATFSNAVRFIALDLLPYFEILDAKINLFRELMAEEVSLNDQGKILTIRGRLATIAEPIPAGRMAGFAKGGGVSIPRSLPGEISVIELCEAMREQQKRLRFDKTHAAVSANEACDRLAASSDTFVAEFLQNPEKWTTGLNAIAHAVADLGQAQPKGVLSRDLAQAYANAFDILDREVKALNTFVMVADACRTVRDNAANEAFRFELATLRKAQAIVAGSADSDLRTFLNDSIQQVKRAVHTSF